MAGKQVYTNRELVDMLDFLNAQLGLERCMDDEEFYLDILDAFVEENLLDELKGFYLENNWNKYRIKSHTLKSSSAYIGGDIKGPPGLRFPRLQPGLCQQGNG